MGNSYLIPFVSLFPEKGAAETRSFATMRYPGLPDDEYALFEAYCPDPECDCRRVMLNVVGRHQGKRYLASISFGFERSAELAGPFLDDLNRQSVYAQSLLRVVTQILADPGYVARLESHYQMVKQAAADPTHPIQAILKRRKPNPPSGVKLQPKGRKRSTIPKSTNTTLVYQLKVTLKGSRPPIWRRIQVPADLRLNRLHHVLQTVMGWTNSHLHQFRIHGVEYGVPDREWDDTAKTLNEERVKLDEVVTREKDRFLYEDDFGDS